MMKLGLSMVRFRVITMPKVTRVTTSTKLRIPEKMPQTMCILSYASIVYRLVPDF